jgi:hypothetical protein
MLVLLTIHLLVKTKKVATIKTSTANGRQVSPQGHAASDIQAQTKFCVQKNQLLQSQMR